METPKERGLALLVSALAVFSVIIATCLVCTNAYLKAFDACVTKYFGKAFRVLSAFREKERQQWLKRKLF